MNLKKMHSQAPWRMEMTEFDPESGIKPCAYIWTKESSLIAATGVRNGLADGLLIHAAPELLACVKSLLDDWDKEFAQEEPISGSELVDWVAANLDNFRLAYRKAVGIDRNTITPKEAQS